MRTSHGTTREPPGGNTGSSIRDVRRHLGMTQEQFAHEIAVTVATVNRWENGHTEPSNLALRMIEQLARRRGLTTDLQRSARLI